MPALFRPVDTNVGVIAMGGSASVELCRMNVRTGVVTSSLLPSSWTIQVTDNLLKLINWTQENERDKPEFLRMLMAAMDSSGQPTAFLLPSPVNAQGVVVVTLTAATPNDVVLLYVPRTDESGFLLASGGGGGGGPGEDAYARAQITALTDVVAAKADASALAAKADASALAAKADASALAAKADAAHNHDDLYSKLGHTHDYASASDLSAKADASAIIDYAAATGGGLSRTDVSPTQREFAVDATVPRLAAAVVAGDVVPALTQALVLDPDSGADGSYEFKLASVATKAAVDAKASASDIKTYDVTAGGGLVRTSVTGGYEFSAASDVVRLATLTASADAGKSPVVRADGKFDLDTFAKMSDLEAFTAGIKYRDAVKKTYTTVPAKATLTADGLVNDDRFLVNASPAVLSNGVYVVTAAGSARASDFAVGDSAGGTYVFDINPTTGGAAYVCTNVAPNDVVNTNALTFAVYAVGKTYTAGTGLTLTGTSFSAKLAGVADVPTMNSGANGTPGTSDNAARANHLHPSDTSRLAVAGGTLTGVVTYDTATNAALTSITATPDGKTLASVDYVSAKVASGAAAGVPFATTTSAGKVIVGTGLSVVTTAGATQGTVSVAYGAAANTATQGNDIRLNYAPVGAADKGKLAVISSGGAWATVGAGTTDQVLRWDSTTGLPVWGSLPGLSAYAPIASPSFTGTVTVPAVTDASADTTAATVKYIKDKLTSSSLQIASATVLGGVKVGTGLSVDGTGLMSVNFTGYATTIALNAAVAAVPYDIAGSVFGTLTPTDKPFLFVAPRALKITNTANVNFRALTAGATGSTTFFLYKQAASGGSPVKLGTATFSASSLTGSYVPEVGVTAANLALAAGDYVYLEVGPSVDSAFKTVFFTVGCTVG